MHAAHVSFERTPGSPSVALSGDGRHLVMIRGGALHIDGVPTEISAAAAALLDREVWCVSREPDGHWLERLSFDGERIGAATQLGDLGSAVRLAVSRHGVHALVTGERELELRAHRGGITIGDLGRRERDPRILVPGRGVLERRGNVLVLLRAGTRAELSLALPDDLRESSVSSGATLLDGAAIVIETAARGQHVLLTYDARRGELRSRVRIGDASVLAIAERACVAVIGHERHLALLDLRAGRCRCERVLDTPVRSVAVDADSQRVVVVDVAGTVRDLGAMRSPPSVPAEPLEPVAPDLPLSPSRDDTTNAVAAARDQVEPPDTAAVDVAEAAGWALVGLGPLRQSPGLGVDELTAYLDDLRTWIGALCRTALAVAWDTGRIPRDPGGATLATEIDASAGARGLAGDAVTNAREMETAAAQRLRAWARRGVPHVEIAHELQLSSRATSLLLVIAAPQIWGELARAYGVITADPARPLVDELLLAHLLEAGTLARAALAEELDEDSPLVASGAVIVGKGLRPFASLSVHRAIARRIAGATTAGDSPAAPCTLDKIIGPRAELVKLARLLAEPTNIPPRVVLRGRAGSGRRTIASALAAQAGRALRPVALEAGPDLEPRLRQALRDVTLRGDLPCVSMDDLGDDPGVRRQVRCVLDGHRAPLFVRAPLEGELPLEPGYAVVELSPLTETVRRDVWRRALEEHSLDLAVADELAARFSLGPGVVARACAAVDGVERPAGAALVDALATQIRQFRSARVGDIANRVSPLAEWRDLIVPEEIADSLRELVARVKYRRTVIEEWGMDRVAATARGVTALFQGGPGTGKTMAAGVIARELGYELWRVDLSKVVSKWIGETEKNLATVFDAAEAGEVVLLFDEADSLFGKRTEVKSSNDRNANLETNYVLQRLDAFTGIAILTTNFASAIDVAFRRRLTVQVQFPFPDETERELLWRAHLPPSLPLADDVDLGALARRYQMSGSYIRNTALRAAYLAAAERVPLDQAHLERAIKAVYRDQAKVSIGGRME